MFVFWGDGSQEAMDLVNAIKVRSTENFNWTFIFILAVVFYVYWSVSNESTTFILLIGVCWELSMMFSLAGIISFKMLPQDRTKRYFAKNGRKGISCKLVGALEMALLFALFESFLAGTSNHSFIWVYKWWGVLPVFITTYVPFFLASNYVPDMAPKKRKIFLITEWALVAVLLAVLIPLGARFSRSRSSGERRRKLSHPSDRGHAGHGQTAETDDRASSGGT